MNHQARRSNHKVSAFLLPNQTVLTILLLLVCLTKPLAAQQAPKPEQDPVQKAADAERTGMLSDVPKSTAEYTFGAGLALPGWADMKGTKVVKDYFGSGADAMDLRADSRMELGRMVYWRISGIKGGKYFLGLWTQTNNVNARTEYSPNDLLSTCYLNGWPVRFSTTSDPMQVKPALWLGELQGADAVELKDGDEIALACSEGQAKFLRLALYRAAPARGHGVTGQSFGIREGMPQQVRLVITPELLGSGIDGEQHEAKFTIANPRPYAAQIDVDWCLADYFGKPLVKKTERLTIEAHKTATISHAFTASSADHAYQLDVRTRPVNPADPLLKRPTEMLELNDFARIAFLPSRPSPLDVWNHTRRDLVQLKTGKHMLMSLDGDWKGAPLTTRRVPEAVPADLTWNGRHVPDLEGWVRIPKGTFGKWYRKSFRVPDWMTGERYLIDIGQVLIEGTVFLNGQKVACKREGTHLPIIVDVTDALHRDGDNDLVVCVRNEIALVNDAFVDQYDPAKGEATWLNLDYAGEASPDSITMDTVCLRTAPAVQVKQTIVVPKVQEGKLKILTRVENFSKEARDVQLQFGVEQFGNAVSAEFPATQVHVEAGKVTEATVMGTVKGIVNYTPHNPALAKLSVTVLQDGKAVDQYNQRFGYRDVRVDKTDLKLNGQPARLLGAFQHGPPNVYERNDGVSASRDYSLHDGWNSADLYDEIGKMTYEVLDAPGMSIGWKILNNVKYWDSQRRVAVETVWQLGNHPCIMGYDDANEIYHYEPYVAGPEGQDKLGELLFSLVQEIRNKIDPDYWFFSDGDEDLGGRLAFTSFHYLSHGINDGTMSAPEAFGDQTNGCFHYSPDCFYINGAAKEPKLGTVLGLRPDWVYGSKACGDTEIFWFHGSKNGIYNCAALGDKAAISSNYHFWTARGMAWTKESLDGYRDMNMAFIGGVYWRPFMQVGLQSVTFAMPQKEVRYFSGARYDHRLSVFDDELAPGKLLFAWQLLDDKGQRVAGGEISMTSTNKFIGRDHVAFEAPQVSQRTRFTLTMDLSKDGRQRAYEERVLEVWPALESVRIKAPAAATVVFDPKGQLAPALKAMGCDVKTITTLDEKSLAGAAAMIVGPMAIDDSMSAEAQAIRNFAAAGRRVIVLEQLSALAVPADTYVEHKGKFTVAFVAAKDHPVMQGLEDVDFQMWNPGHLVTERIYRRAGRGNFMTLVECGHQGGLHWTPLMEVYIGKGSVLATQLPLTSRLSTEPMAAEMLRRMMAYLDQPVFRSPQTELVVLDVASEAVKTRLSEVRADTRIVKELGAGEAKASASLLDLTNVKGSPKDDLTASLKTYLANGGTLIVHRATPEHAPWLSDLIGKSVKITVPLYQSWEDRQMIDQSNPLTAGISNVDLYWRSHIISEAPDATEQVSNGVQKYRNQVQYLVRVEGVRDLLFPGGLVDVAVGKGRVIVDQLQWEMPDDDIVGGSPKRVLSMLLTNLGVSQKPPTAKPALPADVTYETLDISAQANTGISDTHLGDKKPNWCGWGPKSDIHDLPTGKVMLGVPFQVPSGDRNAIALRTNCVDYLQKFPDTVTVPVGKGGVAGLWFLHSGGWANGKACFGRREICYSDGTKEILEMNGTNMADWNYGHDQFPDEEGTTTTIAWKGCCQQYPVTRVYKTLWVNPHPDKRIDKIVLTNAGLPDTQWRFVPHLAITLAMAPTGSALKPTGDAAKAKALISEATSALESKDTPKAITKLEQAIAADVANTGAWQLLTSLRAKTDDAKTFTALCRRWMAADPKNYQPYNALGAFLEQHGQPEEALKLYKRSLEIEWNQPPTAEAVRRLDSALKK